MNKGVLAIRAAEYNSQAENARAKTGDVPEPSGEGRKGWKVTAVLGDDGETATFYARTKKELPKLPVGTVYESVRFTDEELESLPGVPAELVF